MGADAVRSGRVRLLIRRQKSEDDYEKRVHAGQRRACVGHLAKSSVLTLSLQSRNKTNASLKSGPAKAGPAGPATPPLILLVTCDITDMSAK